MNLELQAALWRRMCRECQPFDLEAAPVIVVAVSGGADSMALLHLLHASRGPQGLVVAHLNHQLRASAAADAAFVVQQASQWGLLCVTEAVDVAAQAAAEQIGLEAAGRVARYTFLARVAREVGATAVVAGHHADDQVETLLLHLLRGSGSAGLQGMRPVAPLPGSADLTLLRPFLSIKRAELRDYCNVAQLPFHEDASNVDPRFFRNRLRHELLPMLQQYSPRIERHLHHTATILAADYAQLRDAFAARWVQLRSGAGAGWQQLSREAFGAASVSEQRMALRTAVHTLRPGVEISFRAVEVARHHALEAHAGGSGDLPGALRYRIGYRHIWIAAKDATFPVDAPQTAGEMPLSVPGEQSLGQGWWLRATLCSPPTDITEKKSPWEVFVALRPETPLFVRGRKPGERMQPLGMKGQHAALKKIMINRKIDRELRPSWPLVTTTEHPVWLVGHLLDERARVRGNERQVVHLRCHQPESKEG